MSDAEKYILFNPTNADNFQIGKKATGLLGVQKNLVPKFIVLKVSLFQLWLSDPKEANSALDKILPKIISFFIGKTVIVRSSASKENFEQRGFYESSKGNVKHHEIKSVILKLWCLNSPKIKSDSELYFGLIIQEYIRPVLLGHLSNERRLSKNPNLLFYEILNSKNEFLNNDSFQIKESSDNHIDPKCNTKTYLIQVLQKIASLKSESRLHFEWVWDGNRIWIVQKDFEIKIQNDDEPGKIWKQKGKIVKTKTKKFSVLKTILESENSWKKVDCVMVFGQVGLPTGEVYIIEGAKILKNIYQDINGDDLESDLNWLLSSPIVIRTDTNLKGNHSYLLPRTETLFKISEVKKFIKTNIENLLNQDVKLDNMCFLLHRFIISKSCALAFSKPDIPRTRIDSTWGIVDGLYYHPHDSFEYNSSNRKTKERLRCKTEYLDVDNSGKWISKICNEKYDWKRSLTLSEIKNISNYNEKLATFLKRPVTVMYFVGIFKNTGYPSILPWYYTTEEIPESSEKFSEIIFSEKKIIIKTREDFANFKNSFVISPNKITLQLKLLPSLLRDRDLLEEIGKFSYKKHIPVEIEGSILSHPYYILKKNGATVKAKDPFDPSYPKQEFYKLVRDKIPVLIQSKGEYVKAVRITSSQTLELIKQKLIEEAFECFWERKSDDIIEELSDIYELLRGASNIFDVDISEIEKIADKKKEKRGGFDKNIFLIETKEESLIKVKTIDPTEIMHMNFTSEWEKGREILIPVHKKCNYSKEKKILSIPYIPSLVDSASKKREETISIDSNSYFLVSFNKTDISLRIIRKVRDEDKFQLTIDFGE